MRKFTLHALSKRLLAFLLAVAFLFLALFGRLFYLQVIAGKELQTRALEQWVRDLPITPARGKILDSNGELLAGNTTVYAVYVRPKAVTEPQRTAEFLSRTLDLDPEALLQKIQNRGVSEYTLKRQVDKETADLIIAEDLDGVYLSMDNLRVYPEGDLLSQVLGFVSVDSVGQAGLEQYYDEYLKGIEGEILTQADLQGVEIPGSSTLYRPALPGLDLTLTVDAEIQRIAENVMEQAWRVHNPKGARAIVMDPKTGAVLAMVNKPSLDLNDLPRDDLALLNSCSRNSLVIDIYEPGSTFKIFTAAADLEEYRKGNPKAFSAEHIFGDSRTRVVDGQTIRCWDGHTNGKHSHQNLQAALNNSCNPIFVDLALALGTETFYDYIRAFGFGKPTGIDYPGEQGGLLLDESLVKNCDLARIGFGQTIAMTPLQLIAGVSAVVNGGTYCKPYLLSEIRSADGTLVKRIYPSAGSRVISEETSAQMRRMLEEVVTSGSGKQAYIEGYRVGGKTGTAQKYENGVIAEGKYVSSFIGFFPADDPQYIALIIMDEPEGQHYGSIVAAPYAKLIFEQIIAAKDLKPSL